MWDTSRFDRAYEVAGRFTHSHLRAKVSRDVHPFGRTGRWNIGAFAVIEARGQRSQELSGNILLNDAVPPYPVKIEGAVVSGEIGKGPL
jgi:hypothetical protein